MSAESRIVGTLLLGLFAVFCGQVQSNSIADAEAIAQLGPLGPNPLALQADPNFLRFGRSSSAAAGEGEAEAWKRASQSANFLRFGKSAPSEPNFLRFGRAPAVAAKRLTLSQSKGGSSAVDPSLLRFGRSSAKNNFLRFGRSLAEVEPLVVAEEAFEREYRQPNPNFLRFG